MGKGIDAARLHSPEHAAVLDDFKDQLLIVCMKRLAKGAGRKIRIPVAEVDNTGGDMLAFAIVDGVFEFELRRKS